MPHSNDCIMTKLGPTYGYLSVQEVILAWLRAQAGVTSWDLMEAWSQLFDQAAIPLGAHGDRLHAWLVAQGAGAASDNLQDMWNNYWCNIHV